MYEHEWNRLRARDPEHSARYAQRWRDLAAAGHDLDGEARFVSALVPPGSSVLDAGCGTGRVGGYLAARGYRVIGIDLDETLIEEARSSYPDAEWRVGDLAAFDFRQVESVDVSPVEGHGFDLVVSAGNVLTFLDPASRLPALARLRDALAEKGRVATGFGAGRGYSFEQYDDDLAQSGLRVEARFATWDLRPFSANSDFYVCVSAAAPSSRQPVSSDG